MLFGDDWFGLNLLDLCIFGYCCFYLIELLETDSVWVLIGVVRMEI